MLNSETDVFFHVYVVESNKEINYDEYNGLSKLFEVKTIYTDVPFGYNAYLNIGRKAGNSPYVALCNSDLLYNKNWASNIVKEMRNNPEILSATPYNSFLYDAIFQRREIYDIIGDLDEAVKFHYCDNLYAVQILLHGIKHHIIHTSSVEHKGRSGSTFCRVVEYGSDKYVEYTEGQKPLFEKRVLELVLSALDRNYR